MINVTSCGSKFAALSETIRRLDAQTEELESQMRVPVGDFDPDVSHEFMIVSRFLLASIADCSLP